MKNKFAAFFTGLFFILLGLSFYSGQKPGEWDFETFGKLPVVQGGRAKPLDSVARNSLLILSGKQSFIHEGAKISSIHWLVDMVFNPQVADQYPVFEIDHPEVLGLFHIEQSSRRRFSYNEIHQYNSELEKQSMQIGSIKPQDQTAFQRAVILLMNRINLYQKLENTVQLVGVIQTADDLKKFQELSVGVSTQDLTQPMAFGKPSPLNSEFLSRLAQHFRFVDSFSCFVALPPLSSTGEWQTLGGGLLSPENGVWHQGILAYAQMADFYRAGNKDGFNTTVRNYFEWVGTLKIKELIRTKAEFIFNRVEPFYFCMVFYFLVSLLIFINWLTKLEFTGDSARVLLGLTFCVHTIALISRMIIQGRPPVTNLYSSAIFVGWVAIVLGIFIEKIYKNLFGALVSAVIGFLTLLIAHHLSMQGDTLEMMQAVLDSNFWLATHVVTVTMGYGSTFLAGFIGTAYILKRSFSTTFEKEQARSLAKMTYGVICFATLFSFIGTILGGIWADQSWGRFWGWDPKENGALMIVLWNVTILHARWGGYAKDRGIMILAVIGNVVTSLSWFGVNMLGIGLHSYGFMDKAFYWLCGFIVIQAFIVVMGLTLKKE